MRIERALTCLGIYLGTFAAGCAGAVATVKLLGVTSPWNVALLALIFGSIVYVGAEYLCKMAAQRVL